MTKLVDGTGRGYRTSSVPAGPYTAHIDLGGYTVTKPIQVPSNGEVTLECKAMNGKCELQQ